MIGPGVAASVWLLATLGDGPSVGASDCPSWNDVTEAVFSASGKRPTARTLTWEVLRDINLVRVRLPDVDEPSESHDLRLSRQSCEELAHSIAVIWLGAHTQPQEIGIGAPVLPIALETTDARDAGTKPPGAPNADLKAKAITPDTTSATSIEVEGAALAAWSGTNAAASLRLGLALAFAQSLGLRLTADQTAAMREEIGPGHGEWRRRSLGIGVFHRMHLKKWFIEVEPALVLSRLQLAGAGFSSNASGSANEIGSRLGMRLAWPTEVITPMLMLSADGWFGQSALLVQNLPSVESVPRWTLAFGAGLMWGNSARKSDASSNDP